MYSISFRNDRIFLFFHYISFYKRPQYFLRVVCQLTSVFVYRISLYLHIGLNLTHNMLRPDFHSNLYQAVSISLLGDAAFLKIRFVFTLYRCKNSTSFSCLWIQIFISIVISHKLIDPVRYTFERTGIRFHNHLSIGFISIYVNSFMKVENQSSMQCFSSLIVSWFTFLDSNVYYQCCQKSSV